MRDYYEDIPEDRFVPLDDKGLYEINKLGDIRTVSSGLIRYHTKHKNNISGYPCVVLGNEYSKAIPVHILLARTFIPNPENKPLVDHINKNRECFELTNLRWVTYSENNSNRTTNEKHERFYVKLDDYGNEVERFSSLSLDKTKKSRIRLQISRGQKHDGFFWKIEDQEIEDYISRFGFPEENDWKTCLRFPMFECNKNGMMRKKGTKKLTIGTKIATGYRKIFYKGKGYSIHRLVYETFSEELLNEEDVIDHISTVKDDNRFSNLRKGTQKDNMNNPLTKNKISKAVKQFSYDGSFVKEYNSVEDIGKEFETSAGSVRNCIKYRCTFKGYLWCYSGEEYKIDELFKRLIFKYDPSKELVSVYRSIREAEKESKSDRKTISGSIQSGKLCSDGFYYSKGPMI